MIIFSLEALADDSHRRHYIDPSVRDDCVLYMKGTTQERWLYRDRFKMSEPPIQMSFIPDWEAYYDACDKDILIESTGIIYEHIAYSPFESNIEIWSTLCESQREKVLKWIVKQLYWDGANTQYLNQILKMRPIGDNSPAHQLKERWLQGLWSKLEPATEEVKEYKRTDIDFVFESDPESTQMFRKHGIFVFDCNQSK